MIRNAVTRALARQVAAPASLLLALAAPALAGDRAGFEIIGYSADARYFAFQEFGIQDGSGFTYANVQILDIPNDRWVKGTPVRYRTEEEGVLVSAVQAQALAEARPLLDQYGVSEPADSLAMNGDGQIGASFDQLRIGLPGYGLSDPQDPFDLTMETFFAEGDPACADYQDEPLVGFALSLTQDGQTREIHRDGRVPVSRGCTQAYRLYAVVMPFDNVAVYNADPMASAIAIVSVYSLGFEGPDRRFIAVPLGL